MEKKRSGKKDPKKGRIPREKKRRRHSKLKEGKWSREEGKVDFLHRRKDSNSKDRYTDPSSRNTRKKKGGNTSLRKDNFLPFTVSKGERIGLDTVEKEERKKPRERGGLISFFISGSLLAERKESVNRHSSIVKKKGLSKTEKGGGRAVTRNLAREEGEEEDEP